MADSIIVAKRLDSAIRKAGVSIIGVSIGDPTNKLTWKVHPPSLQSAAQPHIDAFNPDDPSHVQAEAAAQRDIELAMKALKAISIAIHKRMKAFIPTDTTTLAQWEAIIKAEWDALKP